jgi:succinate dehydrogenase / fumarate reductase flavoprotein subunit
LVDLIVFGRRAGRDIAGFVKKAELPPLPSGQEDEVKEKLAAHGAGGSSGAAGSSDSGSKKNNRPSVAELYEEMQTVMMADVGIYRRADNMKRAVEKIQELRERHKEIKLSDPNKKYNTELLEILELENLLDLSLITAASALNREESRGAHSREDFPDRDDENWLKHTLARLVEGEVSITDQPVDITKFKPKPRVY